MFITEIQQNKYIYHYTSFSKLKLILENLQLRFNFYSSTNDPKENKQWSVSLKDDYLGLINKETNKKRKSELINDVINFHDSRKEYIDNLKNNYQLLCFALDRDCKKEKSYLHRGFANSNLWAHYGDNHRGVCLIIEKEKFDESFGNLQNCDLLDSKKVKYCNEVYEGNPRHLSYSNLKEFGLKDRISKYFDNQIDYLFFQKTDYWQSEYEFRYALKSMMNNHIFINIKNSLKGFVYGENTINTDKKYLNNFCNEEKIPMYGMDWTNGYPTANFESEYFHMNDFDQPY